MTSKSSTCCGRTLESCEEGLVCLECGLIVENSTFMTDTRSGRNDMTCDGTLKWVEKMGRHSANRGTSHTHKLLQECLFKQTRTLRLSAEVTSQIRSLLLESVYPAKKSLKLSPERSAVVGSCTYIVCRQNGIVLSLKNMANVADCSVPALGRNVKIITGHLNITLDLLEADAFIPSVVCQFGIKDESLEKAMFDLSELCKYSLLSNGREPVLVAIAIVFLVLDSKGQSPSKGKLTKVCGENAVTSQAVRTIINILKNYLLEMAKEVPWLSQSVASGANSSSCPINKKIVTKFIPDIIKFHQQCGKLHYSVIKPVWLKDKEKLEAERLKKIGNAKLRIANKGEDLREGEDSYQGNQMQGYISHSTATSTCVLKEDTLLHSLVNERRPSEGHLSSSLDNSSTSKASCKVSQGAPSTSTPCKNNSSISGKKNSAVIEDSSLDKDDKLIEHLLQRGCEETQLTEGNLESLYYSCQSSEHSAINMYREDLDELDISEKDMQKYLRTSDEVEKVKRARLEDDCFASKRFKV